MCLPGIPWNSVLQWRPDGPRLFKYAAIALALHVAATILQLPAALQAAQNAGDELCELMREGDLWPFTGHGRSILFFGLIDWPRSLPAHLVELAPRLSRTCVARAYPASGMRSILFGDIEIEIGSENPAEGLILEIRHHLFWRGIADLFGFVQRDDQIGLVVTGHRRWRWPQGQAAASTPTK